MGVVFQWKLGATPSEKAVRLHGIGNTLEELGKPHWALPIARGE
ncbi:MAG: hypothetical protein ACI8QU_002019 [Devosia litorisediminis]|jgi:hypothetical protein